MCLLTVFMSEESFLLVSLEEEKAKQLAQVLSNNTARRILDHLSREEHDTETNISKSLKLPLSTVHYNLQHLAKTNLVNDEHFTYSEKGKQIIHYSLSNKYVIIAPKKTELLKEKLKKFLPVVLVCSVVAYSIKYFRSPVQELLSSEQLKVAEEGAKVLADAIPATQTSFSNQEFAIWFLFGTVFALVVYFIWAELILKKR